MLWRLHQHQRIHLPHLLPPQLHPPQLHRTLIDKQVTLIDKIDKLSGAQTRQERPYRRNNGRCYKCDKPGHIARNCRATGTGNAKPLQ